MAAVTEHDTAASVGELVQRLCGFAVNEMGLSGCALVLISGTESASVLAGAGRHARTVTGLQMELGEGPCLHAHASGIPVLLPDWTTPGLLEAPQPGEDGAMSNPRYTAEMRERAVKMVMQVRRESGQEKGAVARVAQQLGIGREALRGWVAQAEVDSGARPGTTSDDKQRIKELERENSELRRANEILKAASAYFARELGPSLPR